MSAAIDRYEIICVCGSKTMTHYLEGKCECGMPWKIEWKEAAKQYNQQTKTRIVKSPKLLEGKAR